MAKRLMDTEIFVDRFVAGLPKDYKILWLFVLLDCDHAGIWRANFPVFRAATSADVEEAEACRLFGDRIQVLASGDWFVPGFLKFQYGLPLNLKIGAVASAHKILVSKGLSENIQTVQAQTQNCLPTVKNKNKSKNKDKYKDKDKNLNPELDAQVEACYAAYPNSRYDGSSTAKGSKDKMTMRRILEKGGYDLLGAISHHRATAKGYVKNLSTFLNNLPDPASMAPPPKPPGPAKKMACIHTRTTFEGKTICAACGVELPPEAPT